MVWISVRIMALTVLNGTLHWLLSPEISAVLAIYYGSKMPHVRAERTLANKSIGEQPKTSETKKDQLIVNTQR